MRSKWMLAVIFGLTVFAYAKEPKAYQAGTVLQMDSVTCGAVEKHANSVAGEVLGTDSSRTKTQDVLCPEYVLQAERVIYLIRPRDEKHPVLLPVGERAEFRLEKDKLMLRVEGVDNDNKDHEYVVVSMSPRSDASSADATVERVNHLQ